MKAKKLKNKGIEKHIYKTLILLGVFVAALLFMSKNIKEEEITLEKAVKMKEASFPLLYLMTDGYKVNRLHGYSSNMDANVIREAIIPVYQNKEVLVRFAENKTIIKKIIYEVRALKENELLDGGTINALEVIEDGKSAKIKIQANLETSTEYAMKITAVTEEGRKINFYTRIKYYETNSFLDKKLNFVKSFHEKSFDKKKAENLTTYLETDGSEDNTNFSKVTIHSSLEMLSWGKLKPQICTEVVPTIKEFNVETASIQLEYFVKIKNNSGREIYNVKEFYRVRYTANRIYLLNYERTMEALFDINLTSLAKSEFKLGVTAEENMQLATGGENGKVAFVRNGELWYYNLPENKAVCVFSFRQEEETNFQNDYDQHDIQILNMDDGGNMNFIVYGYMNRGDYEGKVAMVLYHYSSDTNRIEELVYIPLETTYQMLKVDMNDFSYVSQKGVFYFSMNDTVYSYNIAAKKLKAIVKNVSKENFAPLTANHGIAWTEFNHEKEYLVVMNLETEEQNKIEAPQGESIRIFGDIQSNVIYGYVRKSDIQETPEGTIVYPAYLMEIADVNGNVLKTYKQKKAYVVDSEVKENIVKLYRIKKTKNGYRQIGEDSILSQGPSESQIIGIKIRTTELMLTEKYLSMPDGFAMEKKPKVVKTTNMILKDDTTLHLPEKKEAAEKYYVYANGNIIGSFSEAADGIRFADEKMGVVVNEKQRLIWERSGKFNRKTIGRVKETRTGNGITSIGASLYMVLQNNQISANAKELSESEKSIFGILEKNIDNPINLTGCTLDEVLYFVSENNLVIAMKDRNHAVVITGYDEFTVTYFDPETGMIKTSISKASTLFEANGNVFISYMN
ncbi:MAG: hypothetical protein RR237_01935 [Acetivibrio sp.]